MSLSISQETKFVYSGSGFCVAGRIAEVVRGQSLEEIAQEVLFHPLGFSRTTYLPSKEISNDCADCIQ